MFARECFVLEFLSDKAFVQNPDSKYISPLLKITSQMNVA